MRLQLDSYGADSSAKDDGKAYNSAQRKVVSEELKVGEEWPVPGLLWLFPFLVQASC